MVILNARLQLLEYLGYELHEGLLEDLSCYAKDLDLLLALKILIVLGEVCERLQEHVHLVVVSDV